jgi:hypothetical protein
VESLSKYTVELRTLIDSGFPIALNDYEIFDESYRERLNQKILDHYLFYEIGFETGERFNHELKRKMNEIMPLYNQMYESELLEINPLLTFKRTIEQDLEKDITSEVVDVKTEALTKTDATEMAKVDATTLQSDTTVETDRTNTQTEDTSTTSNVETIDDIDETVKEKNIGSDTPTSLLLDGDIDGDVYATKADVLDVAKTNDATRTETEATTTTKSGTTTEAIDEATSNTQALNSTGSVDSTTTSNASKDETGTKTKNENEKEGITRNEFGFEENLSRLLKEYRSTFLNIDMLIVDELRNLFMLLY